MICLMFELLAITLSYYPYYCACRQLYLYEWERLCSCVFLELFRWLLAMSLLFDL